MNKNVYQNLLSDRFPELAKLHDTIVLASEAVIDCYRHGGKLLVCGNGGSSSDADHIVGELMKKFEKARPLKEDIRKSLIQLAGQRGDYLASKLETGLPAISLSAHSALTTAIANDIDASLIFAQQVITYGRKGDLLLAISTSGNSLSVLDACITAKAIGIKVIGLTGETGGRMKEYCDILLNVPEKRTAIVQELHLPVLHTICLIVENHFFGNAII